jgi:hypothetical protein
MKVPTHQFANTVAAYREMGIPVREESPASVVFEFGPIWLHIDSVANLSQAEIWLEFITSDATAAAERIGRTPFVRCDEIEPLPQGFAGFWVTSPASIVHLISEAE